MRFFRRKYADPDVVLRNAPGPIPWYWHVLPKVRNALWQEAGSDELTSGKYYLKNSSGDIAAIIGRYCYAQAIDENSILVWYQKYESGFSNSIDFVIFDAATLPVISDVPGALEQMKARKLYVFHNDEKAKAFQIPTDRGAGVFHLGFPPELKAFEELLILGHSNSAEIKSKRGSCGNLCLFVVKPKTSTYEVFPQDWFNNGDIDYGYQWVTRVARDSKSRKIFGEGFRISSFVLENNHWEIEHLFPYDALFGPQ